MSRIKDALNKLKQDALLAPVQRIVAPPAAAQRTLATLGAGQVTVPDFVPAPHAADQHPERERHAPLPLERKKALIAGPKREIDQEQLSRGGLMAPLEHAKPIADE